VVEVSPPYDAAEITSFLANRVVLEMLAGIAYRRKGGTWDTISPTLLDGRT
jgi:agmatinase